MNAIKIRVNADMELHEFQKMEKYFDSMLGMINYVRTSSKKARDYTEWHFGKVLPNG